VSAAAMTRLRDFVTVVTEPMLRNMAAIQQVVARGWIYEGVVMCAPN
jgi:hypothetical protein